MKKIVREEMNVVCLDNIQQNDILNGKAIVCYRHIIVGDKYGVFILRKVTDSEYGFINMSSFYANNISYQSSSMGACMDMALNDNMSLMVFDKYDELMNDIKYNQF